MSSGRPFCRLESVVVNEAHIYRGVFGAHVAQVFRRLNRLGRALRGAAPHLCFLHGDGGQPRDLAGALCGADEPWLRQEQPRACWTR